MTISDRALFPKTEHGASAGDLMMSLIHTCTFNRVNPLHNTTTLLEDSSKLFKNPKGRLPWNHKQPFANPARSHRD